MIRDCGWRCNIVNFYKFDNYLFLSEPGDLPRASTQNANVLAHATIEYIIEPIFKMNSVERAQ